MPTKEVNEKTKVLSDIDNLVDKNIPKPRKMLVQILR